MTDDGYAPFPEQQLLDMATYNEQRGGNRNAPNAKRHARSFVNAKVCRDAVASHAAVRERCLVAETENTQLRAQLAARALESRQ